MKTSREKAAAVMRAVPKTLTARQALEFALTAIYEAESRRKELNFADVYAGVWNSNVGYKRGQVVSHRGLWIVLEDVEKSTAPGSCGNFKLILKGK